MVRTTSLRLPSLGEDAITHGAWAEAREAFDAALARDETPEALEGLGWAAHK